MKKPQSWRAIAAALIVVLVLASTPAVAQASTGSHAAPSWIAWVMNQASQLWHLVAGGNVGTDSTGQVEDPKP